LRPIFFKYVQSINHASEALGAAGRVTSLFQLLKYTAPFCHLDAIKSVEEMCEILRTKAIDEISREVEKIKIELYFLNRKLESLQDRAQRPAITALIEETNTNLAAYNKWRRVLQRLSDDTASETNALADSNETDAESTEDVADNIHPTLEEAFFFDVLKDAIEHNDISVIRQLSYPLIFGNSSSKDLQDLSKCVLAATQRGDIDILRCLISSDPLNEAPLHSSIPAINSLDNNASDRLDDDGIEALDDDAFDAGFSARFNKILSTPLGNTPPISAIDPTDFDEILIAAINTKKPAIVACILDSFAESVSQDDMNLPQALQLTIKNQQPDMMQMLIDRFELNLDDRTLKNLIESAIDTQQPDILHLLLTQPLTVQIGTYFSMVNKAILTKRLDIVEPILNNIEPSLRSGGGDKIKLIRKALLLRQPDMIQCLLEKYSDDLTPDNVNTLLIDSIRFQSWVGVNTAINLGADVTQSMLYPEAEDYKHYALPTAVQKGWETLHKGYILHFAAEVSSPAIMARLLQAGAAKHFYSGEHSPLKHAAQNQTPEYRSLLRAQLLASQAESNYYDWNLTKSALRQLKLAQQLEESSRRNNPAPPKPYVHEDIFLRPRNDGGPHLRYQTRVKTPKRFKFTRFKWNPLWMMPKPPHNYEGWGITHRLARWHSRRGRWLRFGFSLIYGVILGGLGIALATSIGPAVFVADSVLMFVFCYTPLALISQIPAMLFPYVVVPFELLVSFFFEDSDRLNDLWVISAALSFVVSFEFLMLIGILGGTGELTTLGFYSLMAFILPVPLNGYLIALAAFGVITIGQFALSVTTSIAWFAIKNIYFNFIKHIPMAIDTFIISPILSVLATVYEFASNYIALLLFKPDETFEADLNELKQNLGLNPDSLPKASKEYHTKMQNKADDLQSDISHLEEAIAQMGI